MQINIVWHHLTAAWIIKTIDKTCGRVHSQLIHYLVSKVKLFKIMTSFLQLQLVLKILEVCNFPINFSELVHIINGFVATVLWRTFMYHCIYNMCVACICIPAIPVCIADVLIGVRVHVLVCIHVHAVTCLLYGISQGACWSGQWSLLSIINSNSSKRDRG